MLAIRSGPASVTKPNSKLGQRIKKKRMLKPKKNVANKVKIPTPPPPRPFQQPKPINAVIGKANSPDQPKTPVGQKRPAARSAAKIPNSVGSKNCGGVVSRGIAKMNVQASIEPIYIHRSVPL